MRDIPESLEQFGVACEPILARFGLTREDFSDPERVVSVGDLDRLLGRCVQQTKCACFGLLLSRRVNLQSFGIAGRHHLR